jgi:uncharacterized protein
MRGGEVTWRFHETTEHLLPSAIVAETFRIKVFQPVRRGDGIERFPVVYATDADSYFDGLAALANAIQSHAETPRFILVGIGYENSEAAGLLRQRDLHTHATRALYEVETVQLADAPLIRGKASLDEVLRTTDASQFLRFIREELLPFINSTYATLPEDPSYFGYSAGGLFGLHTLFTQPATFRRYVIGSPATSYNGRHFGNELARRFVESGRSMDVQVFLSVGELEEFRAGFGRFDLVSGYYLMARYLKAAEIPGLDLRIEVFPGETHATAWALAFTHGLKALLGPIDRLPYWPEFLQRG